MSLGIDVIPPKVCSLNCVYCEVGETTRLTTERKEYIPYSSIVSELDAYVAEGREPPDYLTFSGSGEPTLNARIGDLIQYAKEKLPHIPVAVLTNGTLLHDRNVRRALARADVVLPSLDAARPATYEKMNRPEPSIKLDRYVRGLIAFRNEYAGPIHLEVFILPDYNSGEEDIAALGRTIRRIRPDRVQLNTLDRPGAMPGLRAATQEELERIQRQLDLPHVDIIAPARERTRIASYQADLEGIILAILQRRPCTVEDLSKASGRHVHEMRKYLDVLEGDRRIESVRRDRGIFYRIPDPRRS